MPKRPTIYTLTLWLSFFSPPFHLSASTCPQPQPATDPKFAPGQVWAYKTQRGEEHSTLTILRIETTPKLGTIIHIRIDGITFNKCDGRSPVTSLPHAPFARAAIEASVVKKIGSTASLPDFEEGYEDWLLHCGGIYTLPVSQVVTLDEDQYSAAMGCNASKPHTSA